MGMRETRRSIRWSERGVYAASSFGSPKVNHFIQPARTLKRPEGRAPGCAAILGSSRSLFWTNPFARRKVKSMKKDRWSDVAGCRPVLVNTNQRMTRLVHCLMAIMALQNFCHADVTKLPADDQKRLRDVSRFHEVHAATNLPPTVFALCADGSGRLAEPGQKWEVTDVITDDKLPTKRLIWAVTDGDYYVVHYERGGYAHSFHFLVVKLKEGDGKPSLVWRGVGGQIEDFRAFLDAVTSNKLDDRLDYAH